MPEELLDDEAYCPNCGHFTDGDDTCPNCGAILNPDDEFGDFQDEDSSLDDDF